MAVRASNPPRAVWTPCRVGCDLESRSRLDLSRPSLGALPYSLVLVVSVTSKAKGPKMAIIRFTAKDALPQITPDHSGEVKLRIEPADDCDGVRCGKRLELAFSAEDYARWLDCHERRPPMPRHSHLIVSGKTPDTRESTFSVLPG